MSPEACIAALDQGLAIGGETVILRRIVGTGKSTINIDVECPARVDAVSVNEIAAGISQTDLHVIISPTQINEKQWPGGSVPLLPPFDVDQRIPRINVDKAIVENRLRTVVFVDTQSIGGELVRINMRVSG